jgi:uncharacterized membrane protein
MNVWLLKLDSVVHYKFRNVPLWVIGTCGLAGILVDIDHPITYWFTGKTTRADHIPLAIISCIILCGVSPCIGGLYGRLVLREEKSNIEKFVFIQVISYSIMIAICILGFWLLTLSNMVISPTF